MRMARLLRKKASLQPLRMLLHQSASTILAKAVARTKVKGKAKTGIGETIVAVTVTMTAGRAEANPKVNLHLERRCQRAPLGTEKGIEHLGRLHGHQGQQYPDVRSGPQEDIPRTLLHETLGIFEMPGAPVSVTSETPGASETSGTSGTPESRLEEHVVAAEETPPDRPWRGKGFLLFEARSTHQVMRAIEQDLPLLVHRDWDRGRQLNVPMIMVLTRELSANVHTGQSISLPIGLLQPNRRGIAPGMLAAGSPPGEEKAMGSCPIPGKNIIVRSMDSTISGIPRLATPVGKGLREVLIF